MKTAKTTTQARDAQIGAAIVLHLSDEPQLALAGTMYTPTDLVALLKSRTTQMGLVVSTAATWHAAVDAERALNTKLSPVLRGLQQHVLNRFGAKSPVLADFGFTAAVRTPLTPDELVARTAKAKATRAARHTMGTVQKKTVKGAPAAAAPTANGAKAGGAAPPAGAGAAPVPHASSVT